MNRSRGFTLLELVVAIGIFALVSAIAYGSLINILNTRNKLDEHRAYWRALSLTFLRLEDDLSQTSSRKIRDIGGDTILDEIKGLPTNRPGLGEYTLEFTRGGVPVIGDSAKSDLQRVAYSLNGDGVLLRIVWPVLDRAPQTKPQEMALMKNVEQFSVDFLGDGGSRSDLWPTANQIPGAPPAPLRGVEVKITVKDKGEYKRLLLINN